MKKGIMIISKKRVSIKGDLIIVIVDALSERKPV
jgi:hypothetical protein